MRISGRQSDISLQFVSKEGDSAAIKLVGEQQNYDEFSQFQNARYVSDSEAL